mmetsp:Transcript_36204/g.73653  ORF Transcript_36204/g.73653 Transcript_36204/m.73653 type:complete len:282 (-) Transcript_36204:1014-1859(-)
MPGTDSPRLIQVKAIAPSSCKKGKVIGCQRSESSSIEIAGSSTGFPNLRTGAYLALDSAGGAATMPLIATTLRCLSKYTKPPLMGRRQGPEESSALESTRLMSKHIGNANANVTASKGREAFSRACGSSVMADKGESSIKHDLSVLRLAAALRAGSRGASSGWRMLSSRAPPLLIAQKFGWIGTSITGAIWSGNPRVFSVIRRELARFTRILRSDSARPRMDSMMSSERFELHCLVNHFTSAFLPAFAASSFMTATCSAEGISTPISRWPDRWWSSSKNRV